MSERTAHISEANESEILLHDNVSSILEIYQWGFCFGSFLVFSL